MRRWSIGGSAVVVLVVAGAVLPPWGVLAGDAVVEAKRKAAAQLIRDGKYNEGIALFGEVLAVEPNNYRDHLLLARTYEKLGKPSEALDAYRKVLTLLPDAPPDADQRLARAESERRLKVLDAYSGKIDSAVEEFLRKLEGLRKEAEAGHNAAAIQRLERLIGHVYRGDGRRDRGYCEVSALLPWQESGLKVEAGSTYRVLAKGLWRVTASDPRTECTADGLGGEVPGGIPNGVLVGAIGRNGAPIRLGADLTFTARTSGMLYLTIQDNMRDDNAGTLLVFLRRQ